MKAVVRCANCGRKIEIAPPEDDPNAAWVCGACNRSPTAEPKRQPARLGH